jgi:hypothetical protein
MRLVPHSRYERSVQDLLLPLVQREINHDLISLCHRNDEVRGHNSVIKIPGICTHNSKWKIDTRFCLVNLANVRIFF